MWKMIPAHVKAKVKQKEINKLVAVSYKFLQEVFSKFEIQFQQGSVLARIFYSHSGWLSISDAPLEQLGDFGACCKHPQWGPGPKPMEDLAKQGFLYAKIGLKTNWKEII